MGELFDGSSERSFGRTDKHVSHNDERFFLGDEIFEILSGNIDKRALFGIVFAAKRKALGGCCALLRRNRASKKDAGNGGDS